MKEKLEFILARAREIGFNTSHLIQYYNKDDLANSSFFIISPESNIVHLVIGLENLSRFTYTNEYECQDFPRRYHNEYLFKLVDDEVKVIKSYASFVLHTASNNEINKASDFIDILYHALDNDINLDGYPLTLYTIINENERLSFSYNRQINFTYQKTAKVSNIKTDNELTLIDEELALDCFYIDKARDGELTRLLVAVALVKKTRQLVLLRGYTNVTKRDDVFISFYNEIINQKGLYSKVVYRDKFDLELFNDINKYLDVSASINESIKEIDYIVKEYERGGVFDKVL